MIVLRKSRIITSMEIKQPSIIELKDSVYTELAGMTKALSHKNRLEILDLLAQGPVPVEYISEHTGLSIANTSQHLQILKNARLVHVEKKGKYVYYTLAGDDVFQVWCALRRLGFARNAEIKRLLDDFRNGTASTEQMSTESLVKLMESEDVFLIDVRPEDEFTLGHITNARSFPLETIKQRIQEFPKDKKVVAYCRGPLCLMADEAVKILLDSGLNAMRLEKGFPDWEQAGLPVVSE